MVDNWGLLKCMNELCMRKVKEGVAYCCASCQQADENNYEIHEDGPLGHSPFCNDRKAERGECNEREAVALRQNRH